MRKRDWVQFGKLLKKILAEYPDRSQQELIDLWAKLVEVGADLDLRKFLSFMYN